MYLTVTVTLALVRASGLRLIPAHRTQDETFKVVEVLYLKLYLFICIYCICICGPGQRRTKLQCKENKFQLCALHFRGAIDGLTLLCL